MAGRPWRWESAARSRSWRCWVSASRAPNSWSPVGLCERLECIGTRQQPRTNGENAVSVLQVLEGCERSLRDQGQPIELAQEPPRYYADPTAVIDQDCEIGEGTRIWHFSHIMSGCKLGKHCNLGQNVVVSPGSIIGNNVKIQNNVSVYTGVELEDDVFCGGPSMVFTNVINPRSHINRKHEYQRTLVQRGASLGANSTIVCGVNLGRYFLIGAGAVVTHDVPDHALMVGAPTRQIGWVLLPAITANGMSDARPSAAFAAANCHRESPLSSCPSR